MNIHQIFEIVGNALGIDPEEINLNSHFYEDLNAEQTALIELKLQIEDLIKTQIDEDDFSKIKTVENLINLIEEYSNEYLD